MTPLTILRPVSILTALLIAPFGWAQERIYVNDDATGANNGSSWADAYIDLQAALAEAAEPDSGVAEIWVAAGIYKPAGFGGDQFATFTLINEVAIYGGFDGTEATLDERAGLFDLTILSGDLNGNDLPDFKNMNDNSYHVVTSSGTAPSAVMDGFTIASGWSEVLDGGGISNYGGNPIYVNCIIRDNKAFFGGGMYNQNGNPTMILCTFEHNRAVKYSGYWGAGGGVHNVSGDPTFDTCTFIGNESTFMGGGAMYNQYAAPIIVDCTFDSNLATGTSGGAIYNDTDAQAVVINTTFRQNSATYRGGAFVTDSYNNHPMLVGCRFIDNTAGDKGGAMEFLNSDPIITNCLFCGNTSDGEGGAIYLDSGANATLVNCVFSGNQAATEGGAIYNYATSLPQIFNCTFSANAAGITGGAIGNNTNSHPSLFNCIAWDNLPNQLDGNVDATYSCIHSGWTGTGNIETDPLLMDPYGADGLVGTEDDDLRLSSGSPCIDAADSTAVPADVTDLDDDGDVSEPVPFDMDGRPRIVDDPETIDTGTGGDLDAVVDIGAYEFQPAGIGCDGDVNGDNTVDPLDAGFVMARFGCPVGSGDPDCDAADVNSDAVVDPLDVGYVLARFGACP